MKVTSHDADVVAAFIAAINRHDLSALADLMSEDHTFIDSLGGRVSGRKEMISGWKAYFAMFPDFKLVVDTTLNVPAGLHSPAAAETRRHPLLIQR